MKAITRPRPGFTLMEMMATMALAAAIISTLGALVSRAIDANAAAAEHLADISTLADLGEQFRGDVHAADRISAAAPDAKEQTLTLTGPDGSAVEYRLVDGALRRTKTAGTGPGQRESFALHDWRVSRLRVAGPDNTEISLSIGRLAHRAGEESTVTKKFDIVATRPTGQRRDQS